VRHRFKLPENRSPQNVSARSILEARASRPSGARSPVLATLAEPRQETSIVVKCKRMTGDRVIYPIAHVTYVLPDPEINIIQPGIWAGWFRWTRQNANRKG
jgi:hypothetical protein